MAGIRKQKLSNMTDMTIGSPTKHVLVFTLPLLIGNILQQLYNMVDSIVVGNFVGKIALAAVGTGFPIIFLLSALFMGLGTGAMVMVSQYYGAGDMARVRGTIKSIYTALVVSAIPLTLFGIAISGPMLHLMNVPADTYPMALQYMVIIFAGMIGSLGYNVNAGILQGLGDSKTPLLFLAIACVINIVLDLLFVIVFGWAVAGVAIATIIAQAVSWIFGIIYINKKYPDLHIRPFSFAFDKNLFAKIMSLGIPTGLQHMIFSLGVMALQSLVNGYGSDFMAGFNAANKIDMFTFMPIQSFSMAITTYVGQNIGADKMDRVKHGTRSAVALSIFFSIVTGGLILLGGTTLMRLFSQDPAVIASGMAYLYRIMPFYSLLSITFVLSGVMRGAGDTMVPLIASTISLWLARIPAAYLLAHFFGSADMYFCYLIGWLIGCCILIPYYFSGRWKSKSVIRQAMIHGE